MNLLKNKWALIVLGILVLGSIALVFRKQLGPLLGGYEKSSHGYYYRFVQGKKLERIKGPGHYVIFQYILLGPNGDTVVNKAKEGVELQIPYPMEAQNDMEELLQMAAPGSIIESLVPTDTLKKRIDNNIKILGMEDGRNAKFVIRIINILNEADFEAYKNKRRLARLEKEFNIIDAYAAKQGGKWQLDSFNFIKYKIDNKTDKDRLKIGDMVEFNVEVYDMKGELIVNSAMEGHKYKLTMGSSTYDLTALETSLYYLAEGESGTFLVTSDYGYGEKGYLTIIPPYSPLVVKIKDVKKLN